MGAIQQVPAGRPQGISVRHTVSGSPRRARAEAFIATAFRKHYGAELRGFAPNLMLLERGGRILAAAGWRCAKDERLFLESYLDEPIETAVSKVAGQSVRRERIVEVGHLAVDHRGASIHVVRNLAAHLDRLGYEWVTFTATAELIGIFRRLALPPLALAAADPCRLGEHAGDWGSYYDRQPVVVAGRIRLALERLKRRD